MTITLTDTERTILLDFLDRLSDYQSAAGCNDYDLPATPENRDLLIAAYRADAPDATDPDDWMPNLSIYGGKYCCSDGVLLGYLRGRIEEASNA